MEKAYLPYMPGGRWAISRTVGEKEVCLVQDSYVDDKNDIPVALLAVGLSVSPEHLNRYFPLQKDQGRCPTLEFLELFAQIGGQRRNKQSEVGV